MKNNFNTWVIIFNLTLLIALLFSVDIVRSFFILVFVAEIFVVAYQYNKNKKGD